MKVLVAVKRVVDANIVPRIKADGSDVEIGGAKMSMNPFCENAVEEAVRLKERGQISEIVAVTIGGSAAQDVLRHALAMGASRVVRVDHDGPLDPLASAKILKAVVERERPDLILLGKQAIDDEYGQTGQMLAALLDVGQATFASALAVEAGEITVTREVDGGTETLALPLPAVVTADLRLNEPRFVKLPNLMMAKKKPIETVALADLNVVADPRLKQLKVAEPAPRKPGIKVHSVDELVVKLREAGVFQ